MHNRFIALILGAALAITGLAAPARAGSDNAEKILAGVTALTVIGAIVARNKDKNDGRSRIWPDDNRQYLNTRKIYRQRYHDDQRTYQRRWRGRSYVSNCRVVHDAHGRVISRRCSEARPERR